MSEPSNPDGGGERAGKLPVGALTDPPVLPDDVEFPHYPADDVNALFGKDIDPYLLAAMANAPPGESSTVDVERVPLETRVGFGIQADTEFDGGEATRIFCTRDDDGLLVVENWNFRLDKVETSPGVWERLNPALSGSALLANQIRALRVAGVSRIITIAARLDHPNPNTAQNGYTAWPRLGFDGPIPDACWAALPAHLRDQVDANVVGSPHGRSVLALVATPEGDGWWEEHGVGLDEVVFDLRDGSHNIRAFEARMRQRAAKK